jgi:hypothetical protein
MSKNAGNTDRRRKKRKQKQRNMQRARGGSPYRRIGEAGLEIACYINRNWHESGQAAIHCLRRTPDGGHALAAFLVDLWCVGLKDAWGRLEITAAQFKENFLVRYRDEIDLARVDLEVVKRLVAGAIRFSKQNGMRLPRRYERWTAMLGDLGDIDTADLSDFGVNGGLLYIGRVDDLKRRLTDCTVEEFFQRDGVDFIMDADRFGRPLTDSMDEEGPMNEEEAAFVNMADKAVEQFAGKVRAWCFAQGRPPHPQLYQACEVMIASMLGGMAEHGPDASSDVVQATANEVLGGIFASMGQPAVSEMAAALDQAFAFVQDPQRSKGSFAPIFEDGVVGS